MDVFIIKVSYIAKKSFWKFYIVSDVYQIYLFISGDFVLTEPILEGKKVKGEIVRILWADQIKEFVKAGVW